MLLILVIDVLILLVNANSENLMQNLKIDGKISENSTNIKITLKKYSEYSDKQPILEGYRIPVPSYILNSIPPPKLDYRGWLNKAKHQGRCYCCYSFTATDALEAQIYKATGLKIELSKQQLVDCDSANDGCNGGLEFRSFKYIRVNGIATEADYPYIKQKRNCTYNPSMAAVFIRGYNNHFNITDDELRKILTVIGPVSAGINIQDQEFIAYDGGIYDNPNLERGKMSHSVVVVGYDKTDKGQDYWIIKNSWGPYWGINGYGYIAKGYGDMSITTDITYPIL